MTRVPVAVVDEDHTGLSRQIARFAMANPRLDVRLVTADVHEAQQALWRGEIEGYALLPADLKRSVLRGLPAVVSIEGNGAYALLNKAVLYGFSEAVGTVSAGVEIRKLQAGGQSAVQAARSRSPLVTQLVALFNPTEGYGSCVVPAVALLILQQTLLMVRHAGRHLGRGAAAARLDERLARAGWRRCRASACSAASSISAGCSSCRTTRAVATPFGALVLLAFYVPAICTLGLLLGCWFRDRERALQVLLFTALPMAFLSGFSWPVEALPAPLQALRWLFPSTAGIQASLRLNQMGAPLHDVLRAPGRAAGLADRGPADAVARGDATARGIRLTLALRRHRAHQPRGRRDQLAQVARAFLLDGLQHQLVDAADHRHRHLARQVRLRASGRSCRCC